jgi:hypothetical protein
MPNNPGAVSGSGDGAQLDKTRISGRKHKPGVFTELAELEQEGNW